jgi:chloramphenicol-sensitive protein RarD
MGPSESFDGAPSLHGQLNGVEETSMAVEVAGTGREPARGFAFALSAYVLWGFLPLYMKVVDFIPPIEVVAHRILWSVPVAGAIQWWLGRTGDLKVAFRSPRTLLMATLTASLISVNWAIYVWAIGAGRAVETALGYYINPLVNVLLGAVLLGERLTRAQMAAVALAVIAVAVLSVDAGGVPWVSLALASTFGFYGFLRKTLPIGPSQGFMLEVLILSVPALGFVVFTLVDGTSHLLTGGPTAIGLLILAGPITTIPLVLYAFGAKLLRYTTIGLMQYIAPTMIFLIAVFVFREPFSRAEAISFGLIWAALAVYSASLLRGHRAIPGKVETGFPSGIAKKARSQSASPTP